MGASAPYGCPGGGRPTIQATSESTSCQLKRRIIRSVTCKRGCDIGAKQGSDHLQPRPRPKPEIADFGYPSGPDRPPDPSKNARGAKAPTCVNWFGGPPGPVRHPARFLLRAGILPVVAQNPPQRLSPYGPRHCAGMVEGGTDLLRLWPDTFGFDSEPNSL